MTISTKRINRRCSKFIFKKRWGADRTCLQKSTFSLNQKNNVWGSFPEPIEILFTFYRIFEESNVKQGEATERRGSMVKCSEMLFRLRGLWKSCGTLHVRGSYGNFWIHLGEYWKTTGMYSLCIEKINRWVVQKMRCWFIYLNRGPDTYWIISYCKSVCVLSGVIA